MQLVTGRNKPISIELVFEKKDDFFFFKIRPLTSSQEEEEERVEKRF